MGPKWGSKRSGRWQIWEEVTQAWTGLEIVVIMAGSPSRARWKGHAVEYVEELLAEPMALPLPQV